MKRFYLLSVLTSLLILPIPFIASADIDGKLVLNLDQCIEKSLEFSPEVMEFRYEEDVYRAKKQQADSSTYPQIEVLALMGPSPEAEKKDLFRTDKKSTTINGMFSSIEATLIQPLYTFGKIMSFKEAAKSGVKVASAGTDKKRSEIILRTKELYYGLLLAKDLKNLVLEIRDEIVDSIKKAEKQIEIGSPWADEANLYKLKAYLGEADRNLNEVQKNIMLIKDALLTSMGLPKEINFDIEDKTMTEKLPKISDLALYLQKAKELKPEFIQLVEGLKARRYLIDAERANYYPQFFVGMKASLASATNRDRIYNPYVPDDFNHAFAALFLGLKWSIDFGVTEGRVKEAEAEYYKLQEKKRFADEAIPFLIRESFMNLEEAEKNISQLKDAYTNARKWLVTAVLNFDMGIGDSKEIGEAAAIYAQTKANYLRSLYNYNVAYAKLLQASGMDLMEIRK
jgi:outer membrane protein TolC